jgi:hypothetical protein
MDPTISPRLTPRRADALEVRPVPDGFVVYDPTHDRLHFLNGTAAFVLESCDGATPVGDLPSLLAAAFRLEADPVDEVDACVRRLLGEGLLVDPAAPQTARKPV